MSARDFKLPDLGEGLTEAEIVQWLVKEGDTIELNQPIVEVETEKALVEIPSPFAGTVVKIFGEVGERVAVGSTIISVETSDDAPKTGRKEVLVGYGPEEGASKRRKNRKIGRRDDEAPDQPEQPARALATPPVRKLARDLGVDIDAVGGSGKDGRVTREDVVAAADSGAKKEPAAEEPAEVISIAPPAQIHAVPDQAEERIPVRAIRRSIAEKMVKSAFTIPHVAEWLQVDATELMKLRADLQASPEAKDLKISPLPVIVKALLAALRKHPLVNSSWDDRTNEIVVRHAYHIGIATDTERGLLVPVVKNADHLNIFELSREISRLAASARDGKIGPSDLTGSTITITNVGSFGMESGTPIINHPEAAILAPGVIAKRPWVVDGEI
ncbi:MAG TPA: dihydrolipoamide acetyltransferase family protein, partial [Actinomycetota bacterium]|nr:dihydrolipoamide acetyltransferase family protein [Actinomycetota bacterium]